MPGNDNPQQNRFNPNQRVEGQYRNARYQQPGNQTLSAEAMFGELGFSTEWIKKGADEAMIAFAEKAGKYMADRRLTNSKIRSIYGEIKRIQMGKFDNEKSAFYLLRPKVAYALGRDARNEGLKLFKLVFDRAALAVTSEKEFTNFCNLMESILAYHRANGGD